MHHFYASMTVHQTQMQYLSHFFYSKTSYHLKVYKFFDREDSSKPQNAVKRVKFKTQADIYCFVKQARHKYRHHFPFVSFAIRQMDIQWFISHSQCLLGSKQEIGHWGQFFSTNACLVYWSQTCLDWNLNSSGSFSALFWTWCHLLDPKHGSFGSDVVVNWNIHFLAVCLSVLYCTIFFTI